MTNISQTPMRTSAEPPKGMALHADLTFESNFMKEHNTLLTNETKTSIENIVIMH
jgi:hypothetical protein